MRPSPLRCLALLLACLVWLTPGKAHAVLTCTLSASAINFGATVSPLGTSATNNNTGTMTLSCSGVSTSDDGGFAQGASKTATVCISFNNGSGGASGGHRLLKNGSSAASYDLYTSSGLSTIWSSRIGAPGPAAVPVFSMVVTRNGNSTNFTYGIPTPSLIAYGSLFGAQTSVVPGAYASTVTATTEVWWADTGRTDCNSGGVAPLSSTTSSLSASVTYVAACQSLTSSTLSFGSTGLLAADVDAITTLGVQCTNSTPYKVGLSAGNGSGATTTTRKMTGPGSHTVSYQMFRDAGRTQNWGNDTTGGTDTNNGSGSGGSQSYTVYGRVPPQATPPAGTYSDTIVFTVAY